jgi:hypothetical protein
LNAVGTATSDVPSDKNINSFALVGHRQNTNNTFAVDFDELRIGTTWQDVTPTSSSTPGDYNGDHLFTAADYVLWLKTDSGNAAGYAAWRANFDAPGSGAALSASGSAVPEPSSILLTLGGAMALLLVQVERRKAREFALSKVPARR